MLGINPDLDKIYVERDGLMDTFNKFESTRIFTMRPCIGQWTES